MSCRTILHANSSTSIFQEHSSVHHMRARNLSRESEDGATATQFLSVIPSNSNKAGTLVFPGDKSRAPFTACSSIGDQWRATNVGHNTILRVITVASVTVWALVIVPVHNTL